MNYDEYILNERENKYKQFRKNKFIEMSKKHFEKKM